MDGHAHHHHHHSSVASDDSLKGVYILSVVLNLGFVIAESTIGIISGSMGLVSDAGHNLSDVFSLLLAMAALKLSTSTPTKRYSYGYKKSSVLISLLNAIILLVAVGVILLESTHKLLNLNETSLNGGTVSWTGAAGIIINGATALLLMKGQSHDVNTRGVFLHMLADTLVSVGVVLSGIVITYTDWYIIDPIVGIIIAIIILISTWDLLSESLRLSIDAVPENIDPDQILSSIQSQEGVMSVHHMHIWSISTTQTAMTAHIVLNDLNAATEIIPSIKEKLRSLGISHCTLEAELEGCECNDSNCC